MKPNYTSLRIIIILLFVALFAALFLENSGGHETVDKLKFSEFSQAVRADRIKSVKVDGKMITGEYRVQ
ncbi:MAG: hypothetical protein II180_13420, partial [Proteobacteria bacterium]|nr:hypothetical protein [Pseudomonadota bacterium]